MLTHANPFTFREIQNSIKRIMRHFGAFSGPLGHRGTELHSVQHGVKSAVRPRDSYPEKNLQYLFQLKLFRSGAALDRSSLRFRRPFGIGDRVDSSCTCFFKSLLLCGPIFLALILNGAINSSSPAAVRCLLIDKVLVRSGNHMI